MWPLGQSGFEIFGYGTTIMVAVHTVSFGVGAFNYGHSRLGANLAIESPNLSVSQFTCLH